MSAVRLFGITGKKFSGKDTSVSHLPSYILRYSFAGPLKDELQKVFSLTDAQLNDPTQKELIDERYGKSPRQLMQWYGTDVVRKIDEDYWIKRFLKFYNSHDSSVKIIVTDVRFPNEANTIRSLGGEIIQVSRVNCIGDDNHESEQGGFVPDKVVYNDGTIEELQSKINAILKVS